MSVQLREREDGVSVAIRVKPRAKRAQVWAGNGVLVVEVTAPPVEGKANEAVIAALAKALGVRPRQVSIFTGETGRDKVVVVSGVTLAELELRIAAIQ